MTQTVVIMGVTGTGKTTVAQAMVDLLGWRFAEGDDLHPPANVAKMTAGQPLTDEDRRPWLERVADWIGQCEAAKADGIVTCSALKRSYRDLLRQGHPSVRFCHLTAPREVLAERLRVRQGHYMPASLLDSQLSTLEPLGPDEPGVAVSDEGATGEVLARVLAALGPPTHDVSLCWPAV